jgi:hypothetical protein
MQNARDQGGLFPQRERERAADRLAMLNRRAGAPLRPGVPQAPCDHGLFSDQALQLDLVERARQ